MKKIVGIYGNLDDLDYIDVLQDKIGLNLVIMGGYKLSDETLAKNPYGKDGPTLGIFSGKDDSKLINQITEAHRRGIKVWLSTGGFADGRKEFPEILMTDMFGRHGFDIPAVEYSMPEGDCPVCPSDERTIEWFRTALVDLTKNYEADGIDMTHNRYTYPSEFYRLFGCACPKCATAARNMGYDFEKMKRSVLDIIEKLKTLDAKTVNYASKLNFGFIDFLQFLCKDSGIVDWLNFRADVISGNLKSYKDAVKNVRSDFVFGSDTFVPSFALLVGHRYKDFMECSDYTSSLLPWLDYFYLSTFASWANLLCKSVKGLDEKEALRFVYQLFGYDHLKLPETIDALKVGVNRAKEAPEGIPVYEMIEMELCKARLYNTGEVPSYPVIKGSYWTTDVISRLVVFAEKIGHEGIIFQQGTASIVEYKKKG